MKRALIAATALALIGTSVPHTAAGDKEWATAGKILAGVGAGLVIAKAFEPQPVYVAPPVYVQPAPVVVTQPAPVVQTVPVVVQQPVPMFVQQPVQQVIVQPQPTVVYTQPAAVVYQPAPVIYVRPGFPPPVYFAPRSVVGFHFSIGHHRRHRW